MVTSPYKAIREQCLECVGNSYEVKRCSSPRCTLYPFRFGTIPTVDDVTKHEAARAKHEAMQNRRTK